MSFTTPIFKMFGCSPVRLLQDHINKIYDCVEQLTPFFTAVLQKDWETAQKHQLEIADLEREADQIKKDLRIRLPKSLFLPIARSDILEILELQDRIANKAKDVSGLIIGRHTEIPPEIDKLFITYLEKCINACKQAHKAINEVDALVKTSFQGQEIKFIENLIVKLDQTEHDTDEIQIKIRKQLFEIERKLPPVDVIFLYKVIELTGELANCAQSVGGRILLLLAH